MLDILDASVQSIILCQIRKFEFVMLSRYDPDFEILILLRVTFLCKASSEQRSVRLSPTSKPIIIMNGSSKIYHSYFLIQYRGILCH